jgi:hypothetical protein
MFTQIPLNKKRKSEENRHNLKDGLGDIFEKSSSFVVRSSNLADPNHEKMMRNKNLLKQYNSIQKAPTCISHQGDINK